MDFSCKLDTQEEITAVMTSFVCLWISGKPGTVWTFSPHSSPSVPHRTTVHPFFPQPEYERHEEGAENQDSSVLREKQISNQTLQTTKKAQ